MQLIGNDLWEGGYKLATLNPDLPASVKEEAKVLFGVGARNNGKAWSSSLGKYRPLP